MRKIHVDEKLSLDPLILADFQSEEYGSLSHLFLCH